MPGEVRKALRAGTIAIAILLFVGPAFWNLAHAADTSGLPHPSVDAPLAAKKGKETAVVLEDAFGASRLFSSMSEGLRMPSRAIRVAR